MSEEIKNIIEEIVGKINKTGIADRIILFGSYADESYNVDSDIDLLLLVEMGKEFCYDSGTAV